MRLYEMVTDDLQDFTDMLRSKYQLQDLWLYMIGDRDIIKLDSIIISKQDRKRGVGSSVMQDITDYADKHNLRIALTPGSKDDQHGTTSRGRLVKFYKRFGFKENKGRNANYSISAGMIRNPRNSITENTILPMKKLKRKPEKLYAWHTKWEDKGWRNKITRIAQGVIDNYPKACTIRGKWQIKGNLNKDLYGHCAPLSFYLWKALGEPTDFVPYSVMYGEEEHIILYNKEYEVALDITGNQFDLPFFHDNPKPGWPGGPGYTHMRKIGKKQIQNLEHE